MKKEKNRFNEEEILRQEENYIRYYEEETGPIRILIKLFRGHYGRMLLGVLFFAVKVSPEWIIPIVTANAINLATQRPENAIMQFIINLAAVVTVLLLNIPFTTLYVKNMSLARRSMEAGLRGAMVRKLQQLSIPFYKEMESGRIQSKIMPDVSEELLAAAVKAANLEEFIASLPNGLDTKVGEHGGKLSGGQRQRISIARAIIRDPKVILFDEATSALDSVSEKEIQSAINNMTEGRTTFIVAHRLSTIRDADRIAVIKDGGVAEIGSFRELMEKKGEFYKLKSLQS